MLKKIMLESLDVVGALLTAGTGLSGLVMFLFGGGRAAFEDPTIIWFAPLYLTPLALVGIGMMLVSSLVSKSRRGWFAWSCLAFAIVLTMTAAVFNLTGLASGEIELAGTFWGTTAIVVSVIYALVMIEISGVGAVIARDILRAGTSRHPAAPAL